jgi:ABC-2 type transport system permease protein
MTELAGAVYDRGYRPYDGVRGGRGASRWALWRVSVRRALGLRRPWRQKVFPWSLLAIATIPAIVNVGVGYLTRNSPLEGFEFITYREYVGVSTTLLLFVALTAPDVMCPDRRNRVLPLIFARPLDGNDYALIKLGAIFSVVFGFSFIPHVVLFVGQMLVASDGALDYFRDNVEVLWQVPLAVAILSLHFAAIGVALAATTSRRVVGGVAILAVVFVTLVVAGVLTGVSNEGTSMWAVISVIDQPLFIRDLIFLGHAGDDSPLEGIDESAAVAIAVEVVVVAACLVYLLRRYRQVSL